MRSKLSLAVTAVTLALAGCHKTSLPQNLPEFYGTTEPFAEEAVYFVLTDRFVDGDKSNNYEQQGGEHHSFNRPLITENGEANIGYLGGDFKGIVDNAAYIKEMGFTSIWVSPIVDNPDEAFTGGAALGEHMFADKGKTGYHGYWGVNFFQEDEHWVSEGLKFAEFTRALRQQDLKVVLDIVGNHGSPSFDMPVDQPKFGELYNAAGELVADHQNIVPKDLDGTQPLHQWFHAEEDIAQLSNLNDTNPAVIDYLVESNLQWIEQGAAAFRIDTIRHVPHAFWKQFSDRVREKHPGFFMFGEHFAYDADKIAEHMRPENGAISVLDFPGQEAMTQVFENTDSDYSELLDYLHLMDSTYTNPYDLMTFYDNHDMARMNASEEGFIDAHNWLFTSRGIPVVYYGSETGFMAGTKEHYGNRNYYGQEQVDAGVDHPIRQNLIKIAKIRQASVALQKGVQLNLAFAGQTAAFYRIYQKDGVSQSALVLLNKGDKPVAFAIDQYLSAGEWQDAESGEAFSVKVDEATIETEVDAHGVKVLLLNTAVNHPDLVEPLKAQMALR